MTAQYDQDHCNLCRKRAGLPPLYVVDLYEEAPKVVRKRGEPCNCRHCVALREEHAA